MSANGPNPILGGCGKKIVWGVDPDTGKIVVNIPHCMDPCKLLEIGRAICDACFVDGEGNPVTNPKYKIEIKDGKLIIPCTTTDFDICMAMIDDGSGNLVECPEKLIITPCGKDPLPPIWLNPVRSINSVRPDKNGNIELPDCCHYQVPSDTVLDPENLPAEPLAGVAGEDKSPGDTVHVRHPNGSCYYTCVADGWTLDFCKIETDCCHYQINDTTSFDPQNPPAEPPGNPGGDDKSDGDTAHVNYPNGECYYTCVDGAWALDFCKETPKNCCTYHAASDAPVDPENPPAQPPEGTGGENKADGDTAVVDHPNGTCYYTCIDGAWTFDFCKTDPADCCTYHATSDAPVDPENPPAAPEGVGGDDKSDDDTLVVGHPNGTCYYTCTDGAWALDFCKVDPADCCTYHAVSETPLDPEAEPPAAPEGVGGDDKSDGDTLIVGHPNGECYYTCTDGAWVVDFCRIDADDCCHYQVSSEEPFDPENPPSQPPGAPAGTDKSDGDTVNVRHPNGNCYYTCVEGAWALDFCVFEKPSVLRLPKIPCPESGTPDEPAFPECDYYVEDEYGTGWQWLDGGPWEQCKKADCNICELFQINGSTFEWFVGESPDSDNFVMSGCIEVFNPTCDDMNICIELDMHQLMIQSDEVEALLYTRYQKDTVPGPGVGPIVHHTQFGDRTNINSNSYDYLNQARKETIPAKGSCVLCFASHVEYRYRAVAPPTGRVRIASPYYAIKITGNAHEC